MYVGGVGEGTQVCRLSLILCRCLSLELRCSGQITGPGRRQLLPMDGRERDFTLWNYLWLMFSAPLVVTPSIKNRMICDICDVFSYCLQNRNALRHTFAHFCRALGGR